MRELRRNTRTILLVLFGLLLAAPALLAQEKNLFAQEKKEGQTAIFKFTETFRSEVASDADRDSANPTRTESGNFRLEIVMPVSYFSPALLETSEAFGIVMGNLKWEAYPTQTMDNKYRRGIRIDYTEGDNKKIPKRTVGKVRIRWTLSKVIMNIEGSLEKLGSPAGSLYIEEPTGKFTETTIATVRYGNRAQEFRVTISGEVKHAKREAQDGGTTTTVELTGEGKPLSEADDK